MRAMVFDEYGGPEVLRPADVPEPEADKDEVVVRVRATSVNPVDWKIREGKLRLFIPLRAPRVLGFDVSGEVVRGGAEAKRFAAGAPVFGMLDPRRNGACAEYVAVRESFLAPKPARLSHVEAAALPMAAVTARQALRNHAQLKHGERVLVVGASGGVGSFAVQLAKAEGAVVTGVCSSRNVDFVRSLGADEVVPYDQRAMSDAGTFDVIFDAVGLQSFFSLSGQLNPTGRYVTTLPNAANVLSWAVLPVASLAGYGKRSYAVNTRPDTEDLLALTGLCEAGKLRPHIEKEYTLEQLPEAHRRSQSGRVVGKLVVTVAAS